MTALIIEAGPRPKPPEIEKSDLVGRAHRDLPEDAQRVWRNISGIPARDGHPGLGFRGFASFSRNKLAGIVELERDDETPDGFFITFYSDMPVKRVISQKSLPEVTGGATNQEFEALRVKFSAGDKGQATAMQGWQDGEWRAVEGLYGNPNSTQVADAQMFAQVCMDALESPKAQRIYSGKSSQDIGQAVVRLAA